MKAEELRAKSADELTTELMDLKKEAFNLRFQRATGQLENTARVRQVRRDIARIKTTMLFSLDSWIRDVGERDRLGGDVEAMGLLPLIWKVRMGGTSAGHANGDSC